MIYVIQNNMIYCHTIHNVCDRYKCLFIDIYKWTASTMRFWLDLIIYYFHWEPLISYKQLKLIFWSTYSKQYNFLSSFFIAWLFCLFFRHIMSNIHQDDVDDNRVKKTHSVNKILPKNATASIFGFNVVGDEMKLRTCN